MPVKTYLDTNVLMAAFKGEHELHRKALDVISDEKRSFVVSDYLRLELLPKPIFNRFEEEVEFMREFIDSAEDDIPSNPSVTKTAIDFASKYDISPIDALHVSCAVAGADELITLEKPEKPMHRVTEVKVSFLMDL
jgi:predicted nucleic acid-binding protein